MQPVAVMSRAEKLMEKLKDGRELSLAEAEVVLGRLGFSLHRIQGSHRIWRRGPGELVVIATHRKSIPGYQAKQIRAFLP
jgi:predicted RNA binding protein YcfA (HicA-like mRNA interferase family)